MTARYTKLVSALSLVSLILLQEVQAQNALDFDGIDDEVTVNNASALIAGSAGFSLTCWVKPTAGTEHHGIAGLRDEVGADFYLLKLADLNSIEGRFRNSAGGFFTLISPGLTLNTWQHLALVYDGSEMVLYMNGIGSGSVAASGNITSTTGTFRMGNLVYSTDNFNFAGQLDEVSLWNVALTIEEVQCLALSPIDQDSPGLQLYFAMDQGVAGGNNTGITSVTDLTGHANGALQGFTLTGPSSNFVAGASIGYSVLGFLCPGSSYTFNGQELSEAGIYTATFSTEGQCDSTVVLQLIQAAVDNGVVQNGNTLIATASEADYQWYSCGTTGNTLITGATGQYYLATAVGQYAVEVTQDGCSALSDCYNVTSIGIEERVLPLFSLSPVPVVDVLNVELIRSARKATVSILDMTGRVVRTKDLGSSRKVGLEVSELSGGAYFVRVWADGETRVQRFVRQ